MLQLLDLMVRDPELFVVIVLAFIIAILLGLSFHEFSHAVVGDALGDPTPRRQGRLSLDPSRHLDPLGSIMVVLAGFGWAKPVRVNPFNLRLGPKVGMAVVAVAGPLSNFLLAAAFAVPLKMELFPLRDVDVTSRFTVGELFAVLLFYIVALNVVLGVFNLLPIPPMDGSRVAMLLPGEIGAFFRKMEEQNWGLGILMLLLALPFLTGGQVDILGAIIGPIQRNILDFLLAR